MGKVVFTTRGYIEAWHLPADSPPAFLSRHRSEAEAIESITAHAAQLGGEQQYELRFPSKLVKAFGILAPSEDKIAPTVPGNLSAAVASAVAVNLSWTASSDNVGVAGYQVWRNGAPAGTTTSTSYTDVGLSPSTTYTYQVSAYDAAGNASGLSNSASATTAANAAPVWNVAQQELTTNVGYSLDLTSVCTDANGTTPTFAIVSGTLPAGLTFNAQARTVSGTPSAVETRSVVFSASDGVATTNQTITFRVLNADTTAPSVPTGLAGTGTGGERIELTWSASTDPTVTNARTSGVTAYRVYRDGALRVTLGNVLAYSDTQVAADTNYSYTIAAVDAAGNASAQSAAVVVSTAAFGWTIPDVAYEVVTPTSGTLVTNETWTYDVSQHVNLAGQTAVYSISSVTPAAAGISIDGSSGVITGSVTTSGSYAVSVGISDGVNPVVTRTFGIVVTAGAAGFVPATGYAVFGTLADGATVTITGTGFGSKSGGGKPYFWWTADGGQTPSALGRAADWAATSFSVTTARNIRGQDVVAPRSSYSYRTDFSQTEGAALGAVYMPDPTGRVYVWRKHYEDYNTQTNYGIRTRVTNLIGSPPVKGTLVTDPANGATGYVNLVLGPNAGGVIGRWEFFYERTGGTINATPETMFTYQGTLQWAGGSATNADGSVWDPVGCLKSFNHKTLRIYSMLNETTFASNSNSAVWSNQYLTDDNRMDIEAIGPSITSPALKIYQSTDTAQRWQCQESVLRESSAPDVADGYFSLRAGAKTSEFSNVLTLTTAYWRPHNKVYQIQVSNGAGPPSYVYFDAVYVDDSFARVVIANSATYSSATEFEIQIPQTWSDGSITAVLRQGSFASLSGKYLWVVDANNNPSLIGQFT